ncbi:MAG: RICIN domain-containing protein [Clostridia bacterium]|nr:RICIN domain-containing protein [Clostridia bacterium]
MYKKINKNFLHFFALIFLTLLMPLFKINNLNTKIYAEARPKVSVVVPVYKVEPYLRECMDSLVNQTLNLKKEMEIICIDDGSPDNCGKILDEYKQKYSNVKVIHQKNGGVQKARNAGLDSATGEYIALVDSDDYVELKTYEIAYKYAKKDNIDILNFKARVFQNGKDDQINKIDFSDSKILSKEEYINSENKFWVWDNLFKNEIIQKNKIRFISGIKPADDTCFTYMALGRANRIKSIPATFYNYRKMPGTLSCMTGEDAYRNSYKMFKYICDDWRKNGNFKNNEHNLITLIIRWSQMFGSTHLKYAQEILDSFGTGTLSTVNLRKCPEYIQNEIKKLKFSAYCSKNPPLKDGIYYISSAVNKYKSCLDICGASKEDGANLNLWQKNETQAQKFEIKMQKGGYYTIKALCSDKMLDVKDASQKIGTNIQQYKNNGNQAQYWYIIPDFRHDGSFKIISVCNLLAMDVENAKNKNGTNIRCWEINNSKAQKFKFEKAA